MEKTQAQYEELLKASRTQNFPSTLKVTSSSEGFRVMDPFDWTRDMKSTRDGSCGLTRPSLHWMPWRETMTKPRFVLSTMDELPSCSQPVNPSHVTNNGLTHYCTHNASVNNSI